MQIHSYNWRLQYPLSTTYRTTRKKIHKSIELNNNIKQADLIDLYRALYHPKAENTFFSGSHGRYTKIDHILGHKTNLKIFKVTEIIQSMFSDHNGITVGINNKKIIGKSQNTWETDILLANPWVKEEVLKEIKIY